MLKLIGKSAQNLKKPRFLAAAGLLLAIQVVLDLFLSFYPLPSLKVSFGYLSLGLSGMLLGPVPAMLQGALADILGALIKPAGPYFPGYTLSGLLAGLAAGLALYQRGDKWYWVLVFRLFVCLFVNLGLNTLWYAVLYQKAFFAIASARLIKNVVLLPVETVLLWLLCRMAVRQKLTRRFWE